MKFFRYSVSAALIFNIAGCATSPSTTFVEQTEPTISIRPFSPEEQEAVTPKSPNTLARIIKKIPALPIAIAEVRTIAAPAPAGEKRWEVRVSDGTVYGTLKRWSKDAGMQLMWETENHDLRLRGQATYTADFDVAVYELMKSVEHSDYPMRACIYDNGAVRIVHTKKSCKG